MTDRRWLANVYDAYRKELFIAAWNVLRCRPSAEDAVHTAFAKMASLRKPPEDAKIYAFRAVRNAAIDIARARVRRPNHQPLEDSAPLSSPPSTALRAAEVLQDQLEFTLDQLSGSKREVIELHLHSGLSFREIGELSGIPAQTVASRYRRAIEQVRKSLGEQDGE